MTRGLRSTGVTRIGNFAARKQRLDLTRRPIAKLRAGTHGPCRKDGDYVIIVLEQTF